MKTLGVLCPNKHDALSFFRGLHPLNEMKKKYAFGVNAKSNMSWFNEFNIREISTTSWSEVSACDALFIQRPYNEDHVNMIKNAHSFGVKTWVDYDDDLFSVPESNPAHKIYDRDDIRRNVISILEMADVVTVSTDRLALKFEAMLEPEQEPWIQDDGFYKNIEVIPNAIDMDIFNYREEPAPPRGPVILWRGSKTHERDLWEYREEILKLHELHPDVFWHFIGDKPWFLSEFMNKDRVTFWDSFFFMDYYKHIYNTIRPQLTIVPLHDCEFNHAKSNIAWIESSFSGAVTLAPLMDGFEEWERPGVCGYHDKKAFLDGASYLIKNPKVCADMATQSWDYIKTNLSLNEVNKKRAEVLQRVMIGL